ncbi:hypothetical protein IPJ70_00915 [Candidatus Campbellbacteria bacterium]|nr:MAG: hypothetical protein IPJ70_00915 [Candidatus Campbellbacteria bacterium]
MSFVFGSQKQKEHSFLLCCIESGAVHVALVLAYPQKKPFIAYSVSKAVPFQETLDHARLSTVTLQALVDACTEIVAKGIPLVSSRRVQRGHIDHIYCVYGSPWFISQTQTLTIEKDSPVLVTQKMLAELLAQHISFDAFQTIRTDETDSVYLLEQHIVGTHLNGYAIETPLGKVGKHISFSVVSGALSKKFHSYVEESVSRFFSHTPCTHRCAPTMEFVGIQDTLVTENSFLIVDISSEVTDVSFVRNGVLVETATFPYGTSSAMRSFAQYAGILPEEVLGTVRSLQAGKLDATVAQRYTEAQEKTQKEWATHCGNILFQLEQEGGIPTSVFILGESVDFVSLQTFFMPTERIVSSHTGSPLSSVVLTSDTLKPFYTANEDVTSVHPLLIFSMLYVHKSLAMRDEKKGVQ